MMRIRFRFVRMISGHLFKLFFKLLDFSFFGIKIWARVTMRNIPVKIRMNLSNSGLKIRGQIPKSGIKILEMMVMLRNMSCNAINLLINRVENSVLGSGIMRLPVENLFSPGGLLERTIRLNFGRLNKRFRETSFFLV